MDITYRIAHNPETDKLNRFALINGCEFRFIIQNELKDNEIYHSIYIIECFCLYHADLNDNWACHRWASRVLNEEMVYGRLKGERPLTLMKMAKKGELDKYVNERGELK